MPKNQKKTGRQNYDWAQLQYEYVTDPEMSLRKLSKKHGIRYSTIANKSKAEGWFATRKKHQSKVVSRAISQTERKQADELSRECGFLNKMKDRMEEMLEDQQQFHRHLTANLVTGETEEKLYDKVDTRAMKDAMQMLEMMEKLTRSLLDIQRLEAMQKHQIDTDRLQLDRDRFEFEKEKANFSRPDVTNTIRIEGFEESWAE